MSSASTTEWAETPSGFSTDRTVEHRRFDFVQYLRDHARRRDKCDANPAYKAAHLIAAAGGHVFPCGPNKRPLIREWPKEATDDFGRVETWWSQYPQALVGIACGKSGLVVLDGDRHNGPDGVAALTSLLGGDLVPTGAPIVETPSGGIHAFFRQPEGEPIRNSASLLAPAVDVRADGGYVVGCGSVLPNGRAYCPMEGAPDLVEAFANDLIPVLPSYIAERLRAPKSDHAERPAPPRDPRGSSDEPRPSSPPGAREVAYARRALDGNVRELSSAGRGGRNQALNAIAFRTGRMVAAGWIDRSTVEAAIEEAAHACGLTRDDGIRQVRKTITSGIEAGIQNPADPLRDDGQGAEREPLNFRGTRDREPAREARRSEDGTIYDGETGEVLHEAGPAPAGRELPEHLTRPAGLLGEIVDWITASARQPNRALSLAAAVTVLGTVIGRRVAGPTDAGVHLYVAMLAPSAGGKDHPMKRAQALVREVGESLVGPSGFTSMVAISRHVSEFPLALSVADELGNTISRIAGPRAGNWERGITKILREIWGSSFEVIAGEQRAAGRDPDIRWPSLSILGASNPNEFFDALGSAEVSNGFLNRILLLATSRKSPKVEPVADRHEIPDAIRFALARLFASCRGDLDEDVTEIIGTTAIKRYAGDPDLRDAHGKIRIGWVDDGIRDAWLALDTEASDRMEADGNELWGRVAEMAVRLSTIHAVGRAGLSAKVTAEDWAWGRDLARWSAETMSREARYRIADTLPQGNLKLIVRHLAEAGGSLTGTGLGKKLDGRLRQVELKDALASLIEAGTIEVIKTQSPKGGPPAVTYVLCRD